MQNEIDLIDEFNGILSLYNFQYYIYHDQLCNTCYVALQAVS